MVLTLKEKKMKEKINNKIALPCHGLWEAFSRRYSRYRKNELHPCLHLIYQTSKAIPYML